ncbi:hypothetical protein [Streptomyces roseochromogenus]|nr:hypothetical protein [Streptomyces roseochromogenus]
MQHYGLLAGQSASVRICAGNLADVAPARLRHDATDSSWCEPADALIGLLQNRVMSDTINRLFSAGRSFADPSPRVTDDRADQRVQAGIAHSAK